MSKSAVIIGAGITGVSTALWMQRDGWDVTVIDRAEPGSPDQTSFGNGGILARCAVIPVSVPGLLRKTPAMLADKSQPLFLRWSYLPKLLPWVIPFLRNGRMDRMRKISDALGTITYDSVDQHLALAKGTPAESFLKIGDYSYVYTTPEARAGDAMGHRIRRDMGFEQTENDRDWLAKGDPQIEVGPAPRSVISIRDEPLSRDELGEPAGVGCRQPGVRRCNPDRRAGRDHPGRLRHGN